MPRKKPVDIIDPDLDDFVETGPIPNGHDHDDTAYLDEPLDMPEDLPVRARKTRVKSEDRGTPKASTHAEASTGDPGDPGFPATTREGGSDTEGEEDKPETVKTKARRPRGGSTRKRRFDDDADDKVLKLPLLPLRDMVIFPHMVTSLFVGREKSIKAIEAALNSDRIVYAVAQRNPEEEDIGPDDLHTMGVELVIGRSLKMPDGTVSLLVQGQRRIKLLRYLRTEPYIRILGEAYEDANETSQPTQALMRAVLALFEKVVKLSRNLSEESYVAAMNVDEPGWLADLIASTITLDQESRQQLLESIDPIERLQSLSLMLAKELDVLDLENRIQDRVQNEVDKSQREFYLREQMKAISQELNDFDPAAREANDLKSRIEAAGMPEEVQKKALDELERLQAMPMGMPEVGVIRTYIDWLLDLPWQQQTPDHLDIRSAAQVLEANHYGLGKVKERILEYMAVRKLAQGKMRSPILCFVGPPGVGKTSLGRSIAEALGRRFVRVSLGGIRDEAEIRGHRRTYIGALPGRIIQTMKTAGTINPVFMMDEIDKVGNDFRGDPSAALLEVLDPEQNNAFSDHYLDVPYNLSKVMFIMTANLLDPIPPALLDRMEVIELPGYIEDEKYHIARQFLVPRQIDEHGLTPADLKITDGALRRIIREYTHEAGVRNLERSIGTVCRKVARRVAEAMPPEPELTVSEVIHVGPGSEPVEQPTEPLTNFNDDMERVAGQGSPSKAGGRVPGNDQGAGIAAAIAAVDATHEQDAVSDMSPANQNPKSKIQNPKSGRPLGHQNSKQSRARVIHDKDLKSYLGVPSYSFGMAEEEDEVGVATGVSWTPMGGDTMSFEVNLMEGKGNLLLTGQLGDVMKESAQAGLSYARTRARLLGIDPARFEKTDIHIHVPAGGIPKDGPSAGVTLATALVSALTGRKVRRDVAMTGEITLRGKVLPIGGLKEKVLAAHRAGITSFILPRKNEKDLDEIPQKVRRQIELIPVDDLDTVLRLALRPAPNLGETKIEPLTEPPTSSSNKAPLARRQSSISPGVNPS